MDFDLQWLLIAVPVVFALGWMASRLDLRQARRDDRAAPRAYFRGLNLLLTDQHDKAIDAFIEAVQHDPDTTELHLAWATFSAAAATSSVRCACTSTCWSAAT